MKNTRKKTQLELPGFHAADEAIEEASGTSGVTAWYYIRDHRATVMLGDTGFGLVKVEHDLQNVIPHLYTLSAARTACQYWPGMVVRKWPYADPDDWQQIRARW